MLIMELFIGCMLGRLGDFILSAKMIDADIYISGNWISVGRIVRVYKEVMNWNLTLKKNTLCQKGEILVYLGPKNYGDPNENGLNDLLFLHPTLGLVYVFHSDANETMEVIA
jgi:hypothetical protein